MSGKRPAVKSPEILRNEGQHIAFHKERMLADQESWLPLERAAWACQFQALFLAAEEVLWLDHGQALRAFGITRKEFRISARLECIRFLGGDRRSAFEVSEAVATTF